MVVFIHCACYCKDTHFEAIHNPKGAGKTIPWIVLATAKIHILKQFTTMEYIVFKQPGLCLLLQRYTFWSNSQRMTRFKITRCYCACYCKDTHFEAIHNTPAITAVFASIVLATAKIHILKQFTTVSTIRLKLSWLCLLLQRYTFWSNSQRASQVCWSCFHCACYCKDTHFEAIHNHPQSRVRNKEIVLATAKIHILKQFTTLGVRYFYRYYCACYCKDTHFEAIHNPVTWIVNYAQIVLATAKIHILKQFTTENTKKNLNQLLCLLLQRYTFWSNSQRHHTITN